MNRSIFPILFSKEFQSEVMEWWMNLPVPKKLDVKSKHFNKICGANWSDVNFILSIKDRLCIFYYKCSRED